MEHERKMRKIQRLRSWAARLRRIQVAQNERRLFQRNNLVAENFIYEDDSDTLSIYQPPIRPRAFSFDDQNQENILHRQQLIQRQQEVIFGIHPGRITTFSRNSRVQHINSAIDEIENFERAGGAAQFDYNQRGRVLVQSEMENEELIRYLLNTVQTVDYKYIEEKKFEKQCSVCWNQFDPGYKGCFLQLKCHETHIFHKECLYKMMKNGKYSCPLCRMDIKLPEREDLSVYIQNNAENTSVVEDILQQQQIDQNNNDNQSQNLPETEALINNEDFVEFSDQTVHYSHHSM